ncbi:MAG TPA: DUF1385 domain-containing protein [Armatimonadota bacterium]|nr:DUF1385 domain-containing protein [Armatimonadota bacterium]
MTVRDLHDIVKHAPSLTPEDSAAKAIRLLRARGVPALPVSQGPHVIGIVTEIDLLAVAAGADDPQHALRTTGVSQVVRPLTIMASEHQPLASLADLLREHPAPAIPVFAADGRYLGLLLPRDLLAALAGEPIVPPIGGLATPAGVYLTTGALRAGAGDLGLAAAGAFLMGLNLIAAAVVYGLAQLADRFLPFPEQAAAEPGAAAAILALILFYGLQIFIFLLLLRLSPLTGIHAAEHMVVRAVEEGEDLALEKVRRMPRVHPRCGTNLMALLILLVIAQQFLSSLDRAADEATRVFALFLVVMIVLLTWRRLGGGLQRWVTTRPPSDRQIAQAIAVAESLLQKVHAHPSARVSIPRRIWHSGFAQVLAGFFAVFAIAEYGLPLLAGAWRALAG